MKKLTVFAAALLTANLAMAATGITRQQVLNELAQARSSGELAQLDRESSAPVLNSKTAVVSSTTRAQVLAELTKANASGELAHLHTETGARDLHRATASTVTRTQVLVELKKALASGEYARLNNNRISMGSFAISAAQASDSGSGQ